MTETFQDFKCVVCGKKFKALEFHGLDKESMSRALVCPLHRKAWVNGDYKSKKPIRYWWSREK